MVVLSLLMFYALILVPALLVWPLISRLLHTHSPGVGAPAAHPAGLPTFPLALATGIGGFLLFFSLLGRWVGSYWVIVPATWLSLGLASALLLKRDGTLRRTPTPRLRADLKSSSPFLAFGVAAHLTLWLGRARFPEIQFDPNRFGAEKMFNLQFQQAFTFGQGFPPEHLWFAGENVAYYLLPKALAGLASFFLRAFTGDPLTGGLLFHISDTFFIAMALTTLATSVWFGVRMFMGNPERAAAATSRSDSPSNPEEDGEEVKAKAPEKTDASLPLPTTALTIFSLCVGAFPLLAAPGRALRQALQNNIELWSLSRIIEDTINEYPFWNYLWADNHAHSTVLFLQIAFVFWSVLFLSQGRWRSVALGGCVALLAPVILMSHSGSVLIDIVTISALGLAAAIVAARSRELKAFLLSSLNVVLAVALLSAPDVLTRGQPRVKWYLVPPSLSSKLPDFLNINFSLFVCVALVLGALAMSFRAPAHSVQQRNRAAWPLTIHVLVGLACALAGYSGLGAALVMTGAAWSVLQSLEGRPLGALRLAALYAGALLWIFPELVATNWDMGEKFMRYNTLFRFLFETFYLLPLFWTIAFGPTLLRALNERRFLATLTPAMGVAALTLAFVQAKTFSHRLERVPMESTSNGFDYVKISRPGDWAIIEFLARQPGRIVLAEECGVPPKPGGYGIPGRIAAFSGRPSVCGWGLHVSYFHYTVQKGPFRGQGAWPHLLDRDAWVRALLDAPAPSSPGVSGKTGDAGSTGATSDAHGGETVAHVSTRADTPSAPLDTSARAALENLEKLGVTHLVFGEWERERHPTATLTGLSRFGEIVFSSHGLGVVRLATTREREDDARAAP